MRNPPRLCSHRSGAAVTLALSSIFPFLLQHYFSCISITFIFHPHLSSLFLSPFFFLFESPISLPLLYTSLSLFWLQNVSLSLYLDALLSPWFLSLYLTSFFLLLKDRFAKALRDSSVLYSCCFLISLMSDNAASGSYIQMCFYKHFI